VASKRRIAGRVGSSGGPGSGSLVFPPPAEFSEPQVLQEREADQRHERVMVEPGPAPPLEVIEPELLLELLVRLLLSSSAP
jgi:hypothetical protein